MAKLMQVENDPKNQGRILLKTTQRVVRVWPILIKGLASTGRLTSEKAR